MSRFERFKVTPGKASGQSRYGKTQVEKAVAIGLYSESGPDRIDVLFSAHPENTRSYTLCTLSMPLNEAESLARRILEDVARKRAAAASVAAEGAA